MLMVSGRQLTVAAGSKTPKQDRKGLSACQDLNIFFPFSVQCFQNLELFPW